MESLLKRTQWLLIAVVFVTVGCMVCTTALGVNDTTKLKTENNSLRFEISKLEKRIDILEKFKEAQGDMDRLIIDLLDDPTSETLLKIKELYNERTILRPKRLLGRTSRDE